MLLESLFQRQLLQHRDTYTFLKQLFLFLLSNYELASTINTMHQLYFLGIIHVLVEDLLLVLI
jgi:hypothetical protein